MSNRSFNFDEWWPKKKKKPYEPTALKLATKDNIELLKHWWPKWYNKTVEESTAPSYIYYYPKEFTTDLYFTIFRVNNEDTLDSLLDYYFNVDTEEIIDKFVHNEEFDKQLIDAIDVYLIMPILPRYSLKHDTIRYAIDLYPFYAKGFDIDHSKQLPSSNIVESLGIMINDDKPMDTIEYTSVTEAIKDLKNNKELTPQNIKTFKIPNVKEHYFGMIYPGYDYNITDINNIDFNKVVDRDFLFVFEKEDKLWNIILDFTAHDYYLNVTNYKEMVNFLGPSDKYNY